MLKYYTPEIKQAIASSLNYQDILVIAMDILKKMRNYHAPKPIVQICGPISTGGRGSREENLRVFSRVIERVKANGFIVFDQMPFEDDVIRIYTADPSLRGLALLEQFYEPIFRSGFIDMLMFAASSKDSFGANWEREKAKLLYIPFIDLADSYSAD